ncbi:MAG: hypothetical protein J5I59_02470 [Saprospiraceae bacterium]|nr:hypothetical protein [Saprospiraceae bacterium]
MYKWFTLPFIFIRDKMPSGPNRKYLVAFMIIFIWMAFFDKNRWITQWQLQRSIYQYEKEKKQLEKDIARTQIQSKNVQSDIEKFGRETYLMTKNDEDLFIIAVD